MVETGKRGDKIYFTVKGKEQVININIFNLAYSLEIYSEHLIKEHGSNTCVQIPPYEEKFDCIFHQGHT